MEFASSAQARWTPAWSQPHALSASGTVVARYVAIGSTTRSSMEKESDCAHVSPAQHSSSPLPQLSIELAVEKLAKAATSPTRAAASRSSFMAAVHEDSREHFQL